MNYHDEILDLVDDHDQVIGQVTRHKAHTEKIRHIRAVNVFIKNAQGQLWIPRRAAHKTVYPLGLDTSVGGCVQAGETYQKGLERELFEEVRLDVSQVNCQLIAKLNPIEHGTTAFMQVYEIEMNEAPDYNPEDFCEFFWLHPEQVLAQIESGQSAKDDLPKLIKILYCTRRL